MGDDGQLGRIFRIGLGLAVTVAFLACVGAYLATSGRVATPFPVYALMGTVVGAVFGGEAVDRRTRKRGQRERQNGNGDG